METQWKVDCSDDRIRKASVGFCCDVLSDNSSFTWYRNMFDKYDSPMPWIGIYIAAASLVCSQAMAADVLHGLYSRKLWFPCRFFTLNAASLTVVAVATKLSVDLTTQMDGAIDQLAKYSSNVFMCTIMGHFMTSFGSMGAGEILANITALVILVVTILVNVCIQLNTGIIYEFTILEICECFFLPLLLTLSFSALTVSTTKRQLASKYTEISKTTLIEELEKKEKTTAEELKVTVKKYWVMAETGSLQFVIARSVTSNFAGVICLVNALLLALVNIFNISIWLEHDRPNFWFGKRINSSYKKSTIYIGVIQSIGVVVGTIAPTFRWFIATSFKCRKKDFKSYQNICKIEKYWTKQLVEWKESPLALKMRDQRIRKLVEDTKVLILNFCIGAQITVVVVSKLVQFISIFFLIPFFLCFYYCRKVIRRLPSKYFSSSNHKESKSKHDCVAGVFKPYVLLLEGEEELPETILRWILNDVERVIEKEKGKQPKNLMRLLEKITNFKGVAEFDSDQVPCLNLKNLPPNCWSLPVVTLTTIAVILPNIESHMIKQLVCSVSEGLSYVSYVETTLDGKGNFANFTKAATVVWHKVELYRKWIDLDLQKIALEGKTCKRILHKFLEGAEKCIEEFKRNMKSSMMDDPLNWPNNVVAANSMCRITQTLLLQYESNGYPSNEMLFQELSLMIADIFGACLTNLPFVITNMCSSSTIEKREEGVRSAARLLGETENVMKIVQQHDYPCLAHNQMACIDEWRALLKQKNPSDVVMTSNNEKASTDSGEISVAME